MIQKSGIKLLVSTLVLGMINLNIYADFTFPDFSSVADLTLNGDAAQAGSVLRVVPSLLTQSGSAWFNTKQSVVNGFETEFTFTMTNGGADGMAFVVQDSASGTSALGTGGGALGYTGIENSLAVELDTFANPEVVGENANHVAVHSNGTGANNALTTATRLGTADPAFDLNNAAQHSARIAYVPGTLEIFLDGNVTADLSVSVDLDALLDLDNGRALVGFTAGAGGQTQNHDIGEWSFSETAAVPEPGTYLMFATILGGAGIMTIRNKKKKQQEEAKATLD